MRCEIRTFGENWGVRIATVHLNGPFGFEEGSAVWEMCRPEQQRCQVYYFNMSDVTELCSEGLSWLQLFLLWARESGRSVRFINTPPGVRHQLATAGIDTDGTAAERAVASTDFRGTARRGGHPARLQDLTDALRGAAAERSLHCD